MGVKGYVKGGELLPNSHIFRVLLFVSSRMLEYVNVTIMVMTLAERLRKRGSFGQIPNSMAAPL
jgi:hypothetical protein